MATSQRKENTQICFLPSLGQALGLCCALTLFIHFSRQPRDQVVTEQLQLLPRTPCQRGPGKLRSAAHPWGARGSPAPAPGYFQDCVSSQRLCLSFLRLLSQTVPNLVAQSHTHLLSCSSGIINAKPVGVTGPQQSVTGPRPLQRLQGRVRFPPFPASRAAFEPCGFFLLPPRTPAPRFSPHVHSSSVVNSAPAPSYKDPSGYFQGPSR